jgi:mRNA-degrading endonuclease RelE of RelBE toxin-antitoxin system
MKRIGSPLPTPPAISGGQANLQERRSSNKGHIKREERSLPYRIEISPEADAHLDDLTAREQSMVLDVVPRQLSHQPALATRNRKMMRANPLAEWELRIGKLRVYYNVVDEPEPLVLIGAIGVKRGNRVFVANQEVHL